MKRIYSLFIGTASILLLISYAYISEFVIQHPSETETMTDASANSLEDAFCLVCQGKQIHPWEQDGTAYFFLPSYFNWENASWEASRGTLEIDGKTVDFFAPVSFELDKEYDYCFSSIHTKSEGKLRFLKSANIGSVFVETKSGTMNRVDRDKEYKEPGNILIMDSQGSPLYEGNLTHIKSRGNATWKSKKKSYGIMLSKPADLFSMGESKSWILMSNVFDANKLQNKISLEMAEAFGLNYTSESTWVDLYLNGEYWGNYLLCEKIEVDENRVDIEDLEEETALLNGSLKNIQTFNTRIQRGSLADQNPDNITGGYILEVDHHYSGPSGFVTTNLTPFTLRAPQYATQEQVDYAADYIQRLEDLILSNDNELFDYIDLDSFVARYLLEELVWNYDFGYNSMYFYKYKDDPRLYAGPAWDYDCALGRYTFMSTNILVVFNLNNYKGTGNPVWYPQLYENDFFYENIVDTYEKTVRPHVKKLIAPGGIIDQYADRIRSSIAMDSIRWDYVETWTGHYEAYENNVRYLKYFLARRLCFLDAEWLEEDNHYAPEKGNGQWRTVTFTSDNGSKTFVVPDGSLIPEPPDYLLNEGEWWHNERNWEDFGLEIPIYEDFLFLASGY